jgi:putative adhesin
MIRTSSYLLAAAGALALSASPLLSQQDLGRDGTSWRWDGALPSGGTLRLYNITGTLHFGPASDGSVHVQATKHVHSGGDPRSVHYAVVRDGSNLVICALWNDDATCDARGMRGNDHSDNGDGRGNVSAEITVQVPAGVHTNGNTINGDVSVDRVDSDVRAATVNGTVQVTRVSGEVRARSVNGDIRVDTRGGPVSAETVNGSVKVAMGSTGTTDMRFRTVSGDIDITAPPPLNADVELNTLNGSIDSKYPLDFDRDHHRARGTVGNGSRRLSASTVNGSITLH